eukprot:10996945-Karenia_brevis.AAC.1
MAPAPSQNSNSAVHTQGALLTCHQLRSAPLPCHWLSSKSPAALPCHWLCDHVASSASWIIWMDDLDYLDG